MSACTPTADPLPWRTAGSGPDLAPPLRVLPPLSAEAMVRFDALLHEINPDAVRVDVERMQHLMQWPMALPDSQAHEVLDRRLRRLDELRAMTVDEDWDADDVTQARLTRLLAYIDHDDHPNVGTQPLLGLLDDVLLIELAWPAFVDEAEEYRDFCAYRNDAHPSGDSSQRRAAWICDRMAQIALLHHQARVRDGHCNDRVHPEEMFRVG